MPVLNQEDFIKRDITLLHHLNIGIQKDVTSNSEIINSNPDCQNGMHWTWINSKINLGVCVRDYDQNCKKYVQSIGECELCGAGYEPVTTKWYNIFCNVIGSSMPPLNYKPLQYQTGIPWWAILLIILACLIVLGIIITCIRKYHAQSQIYNMINKIESTAVTANEKWYEVERNQVNVQNVSSNNNILETNYAKNNVIKGNVYAKPAHTPDFDEVVINRNIDDLNCPLNS